MSDGSHGVSGKTGDRIVDRTVDQTGDWTRDPTGHQAGNSLLAAMPELEWQRLRPYLHLVELDARTVLHGRNVVLDHVYFPRRGCAALMVDFDDGFQAETGLVGFEGMIGLPVVHGVSTDVAASAVVQLPMEAFRISAGVFGRELAQMPQFGRSLRRYSEARRVQATQIAACNGHHSLDARLVRCILMLQDRNRGRELLMTHEGLAMLLCAHRPSVSVAAKRLQVAGAIRYTAGHLVIIDRAGLEAMACECYQAIREHVRLVLEE